MVDFQQREPRNVDNDDERVGTEADDTVVRSVPRGSNQEFSLPLHVPPLLMLLTSEEVVRKGGGVVVKRTRRFLLLLVFTTVERFVTTVVVKRRFPGGGGWRIPTWSIRISVRPKRQAEGDSIIVASKRFLGRASRDATRKEERMKVKHQPEKKCDDRKSANSDSLMIGSFDALRPSHHHVLE